MIIISKNQTNFKCKKERQSVRPALPFYIACYRDMNICVQYIVPFLFFMAPTPISVTFLLRIFALCPDEFIQLFMTSDADR